MKREKETSPRLTGLKWIFMLLVNTLRVMGIIRFRGCGVLEIEGQYQRPEYQIKIIRDHGPGLSGNF